MIPVLCLATGLLVGSVMYFVGYRRGQRQGYEAGAAGILAILPLDVCQRLYNQSLSTFLDMAVKHPGATARLTGIEAV